MASISRKVKQRARSAIRMSTTVDCNDGVSSPQKKKQLSFPYTVGSLVSFRKGWTDYWSDAAYESGTLCLIMSGPYNNGDGAQVDAIIKGELVEGIPAKLLVTPEE